MSNSTPTHSPKLISERKKERKKKKKKKTKREENQEIEPIVHVEREREIGRDRGQRVWHQHRSSSISQI